jgi:hypothetical protein
MSRYECEMISTHGGAIYRWMGDKIRIFLELFGPQTVKHS